MAYSGYSDPSVEASRSSNAMDTGHPRGYSKLAEFMNRNTDAAIFRKFGAVALLNILRLQAELQDLEGELEEIIAEDAASGNAVRSNYGCDFKQMRDFLDTKQPEEQSLQYEQIESIGAKLHEYRMAIDDAVALQQMKSPSQRDIELLMNPKERSGVVGWLNRPDGGRSFLRDREKEVWTVKNIGDFISLTPRHLEPDLFTTFLNGAFLDVYHRAWGHRTEACIPSMLISDSC
ncbi:hypothetical protein LTR17_006896 [Elasticomyces elasticus]|nr:hypothetical protein LTR17_006896 [Elasticomyces elasticus]